MVDETKLAWALAQAAQPHLDVVDRNNIYVAIGIGETFSAIHFLIAALAGKGVALRTDVVVTFTAWLDAYVGHDEEPRLRTLINQVKTYASDQPSAT